MRSARSGDPVLPPAGAIIYEAKHRGIEGEHLAQCARVRRCKEEHTLTKRQSWGHRPDGDSRIRIVTRNHNSSPSQSLEDGHTCDILRIRIVFFCPKMFHFTVCFTSPRTYIAISTFILRMTS